MVRNNPELEAHKIVAPSSLNQGNLAAMERQVDQALLRKPEAVWVELSAVQSVESAGLEWILMAQSRLAIQGIQLILRNPSPIMADILIATRLDSRFMVVPTGGAENA